MLGVGARAWPGRSASSAEPSEIGIVGLPNAGKSTLFNALTEGGAETGDYPFTTIDPNVAIAPVPDERLEKIDETLGLGEMVPETIEFSRHRRPGQGRRRGRGARQPVPRRDSRDRRDLPRGPLSTATRASRIPDGSVDPVRDAETIDAELLLADLEQAERRLEKVTKEARSQEKSAVAERDWLEQVRDALAEGKPVRSVPAPPAAADAPGKLQALTSKPVLYVANVTEGEIEVPQALAEHAAAVERGHGGGQRPDRVGARRAVRSGSCGDARRARHRRDRARPASSTPHTSCST